MKLLEENIRETLQDIHIGNDLGEYVSISSGNRSKNSFYQTKKLLHSKRNEWRQITWWERIFSGCLSNKILISRIHRNQKGKKIWFLKLANELNKNFSKDNMQMANIFMNIWSISLIIREMVIKTKMRYHIAPIRMTVFKKTKERKHAGKGCKERRTYC